MRRRDFRRPAPILPLEPVQTETALDRFCYAAAFFATVAVLARGVLPWLAGALS